jgi:diketogulonate reductase-like aldo/keto reductase
MTTTAPLADGTAMPQIGLGVYQVTRAGACEAAVRSALQAGYRLLDTAAVYGNERAVGRGIAASGVPRDEILLTTKIWPSDYAYPRARAAITAALDRLGTDHVDLMLLHQPVGDVPGAWRALEEAVDAGTIRSLGVSNFSADDLRTLLRTARIRPVVDQVELHPYWQQADLLPFLRAEGIVPEAWYPIGHGATDLLARDHRGRHPPRPQPRPGDPALARAARVRRDPPVDEPRAHRREPGRLRLRAVRAGDGRDRHPRPGPPADAHAAVGAVRRAAVHPAPAAGLRRAHPSAPAVRGYPRGSCRYARRYAAGTGASARTARAARSAKCGSRSTSRPTSTTSA